MMNELTLLGNASRSLAQAKDLGGGGVGHRTQVLSYGGGVQTVAMVALVLRGVLPRPDHIVIADTNREKQSTWDYLAEIVQPALECEGMRVKIAGHDLSTVDLYAHNGDLLLPVYTRTGKLPTFCSNEWKKRVVQRWLRLQGAEQCNVWIGFSTDESTRYENSRYDKGWYIRTFPLYDMGLSRADCLSIIADMGWPEPSPSACWMCPNMTDPEWLQMKRDYPTDFQKAMDLEAEIREWDDEVWLHGSRRPLGLTEFDENRFSRNESRYQCSFACMV